MKRLCRVNLKVAILVGFAIGGAACLSESTGGASSDSSGGKSTSAGGSGGAGGSAKGGAGGNAGGSGGSSSSGGESGSGGNTEAGGAGGRASSGGSTGAARGGSAGTSSGGRAGSSSGGAGGGAGGRSGGTSGSGGTERDAGTDAGKADVAVADRPGSGGSDGGKDDVAVARDVIVTDAACSPSCADNQTCVSGQCMCSNGQSACGSDCVDMTTSTAHCGSCWIACGSGETCNDGVCVEGGSAGAEDGCSEDLAVGLTVKQVAVYQSVKIPVMEDGAAVPVASRNARILAGRDTMFRVFVTLGSGWNARELSARLTLTTEDGQPIRFYSKKTISASSVDSDTKTSFQLFVPARDMQGSLRYSVEVVECGSSSGSAGQARFPETGEVELGMKNTGGLNVKIIPIKVGTLMPDLSAEALAGYANYLRAMYPIDNVTINVGDSLSASTPLDWSGMLDAVRAKRSSDKPTADVYYFGLVKPADTLRAYCQSTCTTGIGFVVTSATGTMAGSSRAAVGVGFADINSQETMAHEIGHNHGRSHAPCANGTGMTGIDNNYPYTKGALGVWGYDSRTQKLWDPAKSTDIMGYCNNQWVSDYTYEGLATRVAAVNGVTRIYTPDSALSRWRILLADPRGPRWGIPIDEPVPAEGEPESAIIYDDAGTAITDIVVYRTEMSDGFGNMFMVPEPQPGWYSVAVAGAPALPFAP